MLNDAISDMFAKKLAQAGSDADMPQFRPNITIGLLNSEPIPDDAGWWAVRAWVIANDNDRDSWELTIGERLMRRRN